MPVTWSGVAALIIVTLLGLPSSRALEGPFVPGESTPSLTLRYAPHPVETSTNQWLLITGSHMQLPINNHQFLIDQ